MRNRTTDVPEPVQPSASGGWPLVPPPPTPPGDFGRTVYGPAVAGTVRLDERSAEILAALRAPSMPRPAPAAAPVSGMIDRRRDGSRLALLGLALALAAPPVGLVVSAVTLAKILGGRWQPRGSNLALTGVVAAVLALTAATALLL